MSIIVKPDTQLIKVNSSSELIKSATGFIPVFEEQGPSSILDTAPTIWYDTSTTDNIIKDGSNFVSQITDLSGNNYHALQTVGTFKAKWDATYNAVAFDGSTDHYDIVTPYGNNPADISTVTTFYVWERPIASGDDYPRMFSSITDVGLFDFQAPNYYIRAILWGSGTGTQDVTPKGIYTEQRSGSILGADLRMGENAQTPGLQNMQGKLYEALIYRRALEPIETDFVIDYLTTKHGL
jgi:hypothetical protein